MVKRAETAFGLWFFEVAGVSAPRQRTITMAEDGRSQVGNLPQINAYIKWELLWNLCMQALVTHIAHGKGKHDMCNYAKVFSWHCLG